MQKEPTLNENVGVPRAVIVWQEGIFQPKVVRHAWANNPQKANLYAKSGLPASPFEIKKGNGESRNKQP